MLGGVLSHISKARCGAPAVEVRLLPRRAGPPAMKYRYVVWTLLLGCFTSLGAQRPPGTGDGVSPDPGPGRIEVRFAIGEKTLTCDRFHLVVRSKGRLLIDGYFQRGFQIPNGAKALPRRDSVDVDVRCGESHWHFQDVGERAFLKGWWWIGTDYAPYQERLRGPQFAKDAWVKYLIVEPTDESGFMVFRACPSELQSQKPGPCYTD